MKKYGLLGNNIAYSASPKLHELIAMYNEYQITYELFDIQEEELVKYLNLLKDRTYNGFNITIPYKEIIIKHLDKLTFKAQDIGAVNTVYLNENGQIIGDNTDYYGFLKTLKNNAILADVKNIYLLGTGGAAKTVYHVLKDLNFDCVVVSRDKTNKKGFKTVIDYDDFKLIKTIDLLINCTPVGLPSEMKDFKPIIKKIVDLRYNPLVTDLMKLSNTSYNGLEMLIYQGLESQKIFNHDKTIKEENKIISLIKEELIGELIR